MAAAVPAGGNSNGMIFSEYGEKAMEALKSQVKADNIAFYKSIFSPNGVEHPRSREYADNQRCKQQSDP